MFTEIVEFDDHDAVRAARERVAPRRNAVADEICYKIDLNFRIARPALEHLASDPMSKTAQREQDIPRHEFVYAVDGRHQLQGIRYSQRLAIIGCRSHEPLNTFVDYKSIDPGDQSNGRRDEAIGAYIPNREYLAA